MGKSFLKIRSGIIKIIVLSVSWGLAGAILTINDFMSISHFAEDVGVDSSAGYNFTGNLLISVLTASIGGLLMGTTEVFYFQKRLRRLSFGMALLIRSLFYSAGLILLIFLGSILYHSIFAGRSVFQQEVLDGVKNHMFSDLFWAQTFIWDVVIIITQFVLLVSDKFGTGVLIQLLLGKYHQPKNETRIFMFLDLKSSTTIAEKLKHRKYFQLLNDFFNDAADPIIYNKGEIYQYVGDEITVSWKISDGLKDVNCIKCFFDISEVISKRKERYLKKYGIIPEFKAGVHVGEVIAGEVGSVKKEIVFSGDVLNTASRIQNECNKLGAKLLISEELFNLLPVENYLFSFEKTGDIQLRGKEGTVRLYSVNCVSEGNRVMK